MKLDKEMMEVLRKNLPEMQANAFRNRLEELETENKEMFEEIRDIGLAEKENIKTIISLREQVGTLKGLKHDREAVEILQKQLGELSVKLSIREAVLGEKETNALLRVGDHKDMMTTIFKNTEIKKNIFKSDSVMKNRSGTDTNGNHTNTTDTDNHTITEDTTEIRE